MSLLLDALNRASQEKRKAAAAALQATSPLPSPASAPLATQPAQATAQAASETPSLSLSSAPVEPLTWADIPLHTLDPEPTAKVDTPRSPPGDQLGVELALTLVDEPSVAGPESKDAAPPGMTRFERPRQGLAPGTAPAVAPVVAQPEPVFSVPLPSTLEVAPAPAQPASPVQPPPSNPAPVLAVKTVPTGQQAQDIRRAYKGPASEPRQGRRRLMALVGLAVGLALALGSVLLGLWGDPARWLTGPGLATVTPPTPPGVAEPAAQEGSPQPIEPVQANATLPGAAAPAVTTAPAPQAVAPPVLGKTPSQSSSMGTAAARPPAVASPAAPTATSAQPTASPSAMSGGNEVLLSASPARTNPQFVAKNRGPSAMEQGYALLLEGRLDDAAAAYGQALRVNADERDALLGMAYISQQQGQREAAQSYYRRVLRQEPSNTRALAALQALDVDSDPTQTASRTSDLAARQPDSAAAMAMAGNAFVRDGLLANAAQAYARAQALEPANPLHAYNHAVALDRLGQHAQALVQYERVLVLSATAPQGVRVYRVEDVRLRHTQLRQALAVSTESVAP